MKKLEKKNDHSSIDEWNVMKKTVDFCQRLLSVTSATAETTEFKKGAEAARRGHVMLSYNWSTKALVQKLKAKLSEGGLLTWIDDENMGTGSVNQSMADAVEQSAAVLVCYSSG